MNRRLIVICAVAFLVALAVPAFAAVQNVRVSGDVDASWIIRNNFNLGLYTDKFQDNENYFNSVARVRVDADLTDNVSTTIRLLNERDWDAEPSDITQGSTGVDVDLAYVTLKEMLYSPLTVIIGRQNLRYGNAFIIGDPDTNRVAVARSAVQARDLSARKAFDAVRAILNYDPLVIDLIYSKINKGIISGLNANLDTNLYGINAAYKLGDKYNSLVEGYFFAKMDKAATVLAVSKYQNIYVPGLRLSTNPIKGLNLQGEFAWQQGTYLVSGSGLTRKREASALQVIGSYALQAEKLMKYAPVLGAQITRYSGEKNPADTASSDRYKGWNPMYEDQAGGKIYNVLLDATNSFIYNFNASVKPIEDVGLKIDWTGIYLDKELPAGTTTFTFYRTGSTSSTGGFTAGVNDDGAQLIGHEFDVNLTYDYTEDVQLGLNMGVFFPGRKLLSKSGDNAVSKNASQAIASCKVTF